MKVVRTLVPSSIKERVWHYLKKYAKYFFFFWLSTWLYKKTGITLGGLEISFFLAPFLIMAYNWIRDYGMSSVYKQIETMSRMYQKDE